MKSRVVVYTLLCILLVKFIFIILLPNLLQASEKEFLVTKIKITGNRVLSEKTLAPIVKKYEGKYLNLSELQKIAALITEEYQKRSYILAKAYIPEQKILNGVVEIAVLEGRVGEIKIRGDHKYYSTDFIIKYFDPIIKEQALNQDTIERALLLLNEYPRLKVKTTLLAGREPGTTDIIVTAENAMPVHLTLDYNNFGSKYVSRSRFGATFDVGNFIKEGAILSLRGLSGEDPSELLFGRASYSIPLNTIGTRLGVYYAGGDFEVGKEFVILDIKGKSDSYGMSVSHPFIKKRTRNLTAELGLDFKDSKQYFLGTVSSNDKIRSVRGGASYESTDVNGRTLTSLFIIQGLGHALGAMQDNEPFASRLGADNRFTKANLDLMRLQRILPPLFLILKGSGQWASDSLVAGEQFSIGGADSVRGYPQSEYLGDNGYSLTAEFRVSPLKDKELLQFAAFMDHGGASVKNPVVGQKKNHTLTGAGGGIRLTLLPYNFNIRVDVGVPIDPSTSSNGKDAVYYFQVVKRF